MSKVISIVILFFLFGCKSEPTKKVSLKATKNDTIALLTLNTNGNRFFGQYEIKYPNAGRDLGEISGEILGDTLKGRYKYISSYGNHKLIPFVLLKRGNVFIQGTGTLWTYLNIPYYDDASLEFKDSNFHFYEVVEVK